MALPAGEMSTSGPSVQHLCQCDRCVIYETGIVGKDGSFLRGRLVGPKERQAHRRLQRKRLVCSALSPDDESIEPRPVKVPTPPTAPAADENLISPCRPKSESAKIEGWLRKLSDIEDALTTRRCVALDHMPDLTFVVPPTPDTPPFNLGAPLAIPSEVNTGPFALQYEASANNILFCYEEWLLQAYLYVEKGLAYQDDTVKGRSETLLRSIEDALLEVEGRKSEEWERQRLAACHRNVSGNGTPYPRAVQSATVVDTGKQLV